MDLVGIPRELSVEVRDAVQKKHDLGRDAVTLSCSHTHCGPVIRGNLDTMYGLDTAQSKLIVEYREALKGKLIAVADDALKALSPAKLSWANGKATFAVNRRTNKEAEVPKLIQENKLQGPVDHQVPVLKVLDGDDRVKAILFGYACHATVLSFYQWCGDYPGFAQVALEKAYPGSVALFWAGCGADQNPLPRRTVALAEKYGTQLADAVKAVLDGPMKPVAGKLATAYSEVEVPLADLPTREQLVADTIDKNKYVAARAKMLLEQLQTKGRLPARYPYPVQAWKLGDGPTLVTLGGEVVVDYALRLKKELGADTTWVMGYANDVMAYIPSLRVLKEGGYEGATSMIYYGLPTVWSPRVEETIIKEVHLVVEKAKR
jgi:neutral ceramidase